MLNPAALPYWTNKARQPPPQAGPKKLYDDLLLKPCPLSAPAMPANRPKKLAYFVDRDPAFLQEMSKLNNGVVFDTHGHEMGFKLSDVAGFAQRTKLVTKSDISIGILAQDRFLIILPDGVAPDTFINRTTPELWDAGFSFQPWSPLDGGRLVLPEYKALLTLTNVPPMLRREKDIAGAISTFGVFLATIPQEGPPNLSIWTVVVAVNRLECIPEKIDMYAAGVEFTVSIHTDNWQRANLYTPAELPKHKPKYSKPVHITTNRNEEGDQDEPIAISRRVLRDLCKNIDPEVIPDEIRALLTSPEQPVITMAQAEFILDLQPKTVIAGGSLSSHHEAGQSSLHLQPESHADCLTGPQDIGSQGATTDTEPLDRPLGGADRPPSPTKATGNTNPPKPRRRIMPQKISTPIRLLQRSSPINDTAHAPIPRSRNSVHLKPQVSAVGRQFAGPSGHLTLRDRKESSIGGVNLGKGATTTQGKKGNSGRFKQAQQKPKGSTLPPKHILFKKAAQQTAARARAKVTEAANRAEINFGNEGLFNVSVEYGLCSDIAMGCGFQTSDIQQALLEDNMQRQALYSETQAGGELMNIEEGEASGTNLEGPDINFDSQDEGLDSEEEMI